MGFAFLDLDFLPGNEVDLVISEKVPGDEEKRFVPAYKYSIVLAGSNEIIGKIAVRKCIFEWSVLS